MPIGMPMPIRIPPASADEHEKVATVSNISRNKIVLVLMTIPPRMVSFKNSVTADAQDPGLRENLANANSHQLYLIIG
jgi:hypothetical protein